MDTVSAGKIWVLVVLTAAYVLFGGMCFHLLEQSDELEVRQQFTQKQNEFLANHNCVNPAHFEELLQTWLEMFEHGIRGTNVTDYYANWGFASSVYFSTNVVSTVGYGSLTPHTIGGRVFCVFYAVFGIPLFLLTTGLVGDRLAGTARNAGIHTKAQKNHKTIVRVLVIVIYSMLGALVFIFAGAGAIFYFSDLSSYGECLFHVFSVVSTIGLGDFHLDSSYSHWTEFSKLLIGAWMFMGLSWMFSIVGLISDFFGIIIVSRRSDHNQSHPSVNVQYSSLDRINQTPLDEDTHQTFSCRSLLLQ